MLKLKAGAVRRLREQRCWSQEDLAARAGISVRTLQRLEGGSTGKLDTVSFVADALEVPPAELLDDPGTESEKSDTSESPRSPSPVPVILHRVTTGPELMECESGSLALLPIVRGEAAAEDAEVIGRLVDGLRDFGDIRSELSFSDQLRYGSQLTNEISELATRGWWIMAGQKRHALRSESLDEPMPWLTFVVMFTRPDDSVVQYRENGEAAALVILPMEYRLG